MSATRKRLDAHGGGARRDRDPLEGSPLHPLAAREVARLQEQLGTTLATYAALHVHDQGKCLPLRVLAIDAIRTVTFDHLSLRWLWTVRCVCRDVRRWAIAETAALPWPPRVPLAMGSSYLPQLRLDTLKSIDSYPATQPQERYAALASGQGGRVYAAGGVMGRLKSGRARPASAAVHVWEPDRTAAVGQRKWWEGKWRALPPMPTARAAARACALPAGSGGGDVLVVVGGTPAYDGVETYPLRSDISAHVSTVEALRDKEWQQLAALPGGSGRTGYSVCALPGMQVAVAGGRRRSEERRASGGFWYVAASDIAVLSVTDNVWTKLPPLHIARYRPALAAVGCDGNRTLFVLGGGSKVVGGEVEPKCEALKLVRDPKTGRDPIVPAAWCEFARLPACLGGRFEPDNALSAHPARGCLVVHRNCSAFGKTTKRLHIYDLGSQTWHVKVNKKMERMIGGGAETEEDEVSE